MTIHILLSTTAVIVIISSNLGIEFKSSIPLETNVSIGTKVSSCSLSTLINLLRNLKRTIANTSTRTLSISSIIPLIIPLEKPSAKAYFLCPKP